KNQFVPATGVPVELNDPPQISRWACSLLGRKRNVGKLLDTSFFASKSDLETGIPQAVTPTRTTIPEILCRATPLFRATPVAASVRGAAPTLPHRDRCATSARDAPATCSWATYPERLRESSSRACSRAHAWLEPPLIRRDSRCASNKPSARPCSRSCVLYPH